MIVRKKQHQAKTSSSSSRVRAHSGLQLQVLKLFREAMRTARAKSTLSPTLPSQVRDTFRAEAASVSRLDIPLIEHMLRDGKRRVEIMASPGFTGMASSSPNTAETSKATAIQKRHRPDSLASRAADAIKAAIKNQKFSIY
jgi:hypothetical protein